MCLFFTNLMLLKFLIWAANILCKNGGKKGIVEIISFFADIYVLFFNKRSWWHWCTAAINCVKLSVTLQIGIKWGAILVMVIRVCSFKTLYLKVRKPLQIYTAISNGWHILRRKYRQSLNFLQSVYSYILYSIKISETISFQWIIK